MFVVFNSFKMNRHHELARWHSATQAIVLYSFCVHFLSVRSFQNKQADWLYGAQFFRILRLLEWASAA